MQRDTHHPNPPHRNGDPPTAPARPPACVLLWRPLVVLCSNHGTGWKVVGKLADRPPAADREDPAAHTLAESQDLAELRDELARRGYRRREGWIDAARRTGLEIHERPEHPAAPVQGRGGVR